jgi:endo-1,4-beta-xylanase
VTLHTALTPFNFLRTSFCGRAFIFAAALACFLVLLSPRPTSAQTVVQHDFEDGTLQGWIPRGNTVVLTNTTEAAANGARSLKTTGRTAGFNGPSLNLLNTLSRGTIYQITASVRLVTGQPADSLKITVQRTPVGGSNAFDQVTPSTAVTDGGWVTLTGQYSFTTDVSGLLLYVEAGGATTQYYVDDFSIKVVPALGCSDPPDTSGIHTNFETGTREGWVPRIGRETLTVTTADAHGGAYSLLTTGRQATFDGPAINAAGKLCNGSRYQVTLWAKLAPGQAPSQLRVSIQRTLNGVTNFNTVVPNTTVTADQWVPLRTTYDFAFNYQSLTLYVESNSGTPSFYIDDVDITLVPPPVAERDIPSVYQTLAEFFPVGAAVWQGDLTGEHAFLLKKHFNSLTSENDMKWGSLQPTEGVFTYANADAQVAFAKANNMLVRGHTLVWHTQNPAWLFNDASGQPMTPTPENKALLLGRLENHIRAVMTHYKGDVYAWDVVNEVIDPAQPDGFRRSPWFNITGTDYIERAFRVAHEVDPDARLYINDFDTTNPVKRQFLYNLVADLKSRGVPLDGVGHQMHNNVDFPSAQAIVDTINLFHDLGLDNQITELDVSVYSNSFPGPVTDYADIPAERFVRQGYRYRAFFEAFRQLKGKISSVTFWGQADDHTWLTSAARVNAPLLFDTSLRKKLAYWGVVDPLQLPGADISASITAQPDPVLSGHTLTYQLTVRNNADNDTQPYQPSDDDLPAANVTLTSAVPAGTTFQSLAVPDGWTCSKPDLGASGPVQCATGALAAGASAQFTLVVEVECPTPDGTVLANTASASSATADPNPAPNNSSSVSVTVSNPPPVISNLAVDKSVLGAPNHKMNDITLSYDVSDNCDGALVPVITVTSDQPVNGDGDGDTAPDWEVVDAHHVRLRAERSPTSPAGRTYTITLTVTDSAGASTDSSVTVRVPR